MNLKNQKLLASRALKVSPKRIKFNVTKENKKDFDEIIGRENVRELLEEKVIVKLPKKGISKTRANHIASQKAKGRRAGHGSRKGTANARFSEKKRWMIKIRSLRALLRNLKESEKIDNKTFRELYQKCKGNFFRNKRHVLLYIEQNNLKREVKTNEKQK